MSVSISFFIFLGMNLLRPIRVSILCLTVIACCHSVFAQQARNPLSEMIGKECNEYFKEYEALCDSLFSGDSLARIELVRLFSEAAAADATGEWELDCRRIAGHVRFYESRRGGFIPSADYTAEKFAEELLGIAHEAGMKGFQTLRLRAIFNAAAVYRIFAQEYEQAFACYLEAANDVAEMPLSEFPWKFYLYLEIGDFYFSFREYKDAARFYRMIADDPEMTSDKHRLYPALNGLGLCFRYAEEYEKSDSCFQRILDLSAPIETDRYVWEGIAGGNIGINYSLRGDIDKALAWMEPALAKTKRPNDDPYASALAANIADVYLKRNDLPTGKKYLDIALDYYQRSRLPKKNSRLLEVETRYYTLRGDRSKAAVRLDSTIRAKDREQEAYSGLVLRRVEQQLRAADQRVHERELYTEKLYSTFYKRTAYGVSCALAIILILLALLGIYYHRTRQAYHELVLRSQQWAKVDTTEEKPCEANPEAGNHTADVLPDSTDRTIMEQIEQLMNEKKLYTNADLSLDMLASELGLDRRHISGAINACAGKNFYAYLNEYRVKEAIRIMSDAGNKNFTINAIAFDSGFNDRKTFHRVFKQFTGLTPGAFRDSL